MVGPAPSDNRSPLAKENLHRAPHCDPAANEQAFLQSFEERVVGKAGQKIGTKQSQPQETKSDHQAGVSFLQHEAEFSLGQHGLIFEVVVDRLGDQRLRVFLRKLQRPAFQVPLSIGIEVTVIERRRIHRIEMLRKLGYAHLDLMDGWMACFHFSQRAGCGLSIQGIRQSVREIGCVMFDNRCGNLRRMTHLLRDGASSALRSAPTPLAPRMMASQPFRPSISISVDASFVEQRLRTF